MPPRERDVQPPPTDPTASPAAPLAGLAGVAGAPVAATSLPASAAVAAEVTADAAELAAHAAVIAAILAAIRRFFKRKEREQASFLMDVLKDSYPEQPEDHRARLVRKELEYEQEFQRKSLARTERDLLQIGGLPKGMREVRTSRILQRERRYAKMREEAMAVRALSAMERDLLKNSSPGGAYWVLSPFVKQHTLDCLFMGNKWWPWAVLDAVHPPMHAGCPCQLLGRDEAIAAGKIAPDFVGLPDGEAIRKAREGLQRVRDLLDSALPEEVEAFLAELQEAINERAEVGDMVLAAELNEARRTRLARGTFYGEKPGERWEWGRRKGQFKPRRGGTNTTIRGKVRKALKRITKDVVDAPVLENRKRVTFIQGDLIHVESRSTQVWSKGGNEYVSPEGTLAVYREDEGGRVMIQDDEGTRLHPDAYRPGSKPVSRRNLPHLSLVRGDTPELAKVLRDAEEIRGRRTAANQGIVREALEKLAVEYPPVHVGEQGDFMSALEAEGFNVSGFRRLKGEHHYTFQHREKRSSLYVVWDPDERAVSRVKWEPGVLTREKAKALGRSPRTVSEYEGDTLALAAELAERYAPSGVDSGATRVTVDVNRPGHGGEHAWDGAITIGGAAAHAILSDPGVDDGTVNDIRSEAVYENYHVAAHEAAHSVNQVLEGEWDEVTRALEEALTEEVAHIIATDRLREHGRTDVLEWYKHHKPRGTYLAFRWSLDQVLNEAGIPPRQRRDFLFKLKFAVPADDRVSVLGAMVAEAQGVDYDEGRDRVQSTMLTAGAHSLAAAFGEKSALMERFTPILTPDLADVPDRERKVDLYPGGQFGVQPERQIGVGDVVRAKGLDGEVLTGEVFRVRTDGTGGGLVDLALESPIIGADNVERYGTSVSNWDLIEYVGHAEDEHRHPLSNPTISKTGMMLGFGDLVVHEGQTIRHGERTGRVVASYLDGVSSAPTADVVDGDGVPFTVTGWFGGFEDVEVIEDADADPNPVSAGDTVYWTDVNGERRKGVIDSIQRGGSNWAALVREEHGTLLSLDRRRAPAGLDTEREVRTSTPQGELAANQVASRAQTARQRAARVVGGVGAGHALPDAQEGFDAGRYFHVTPRHLVTPIKRDGLLPQAEGAEGRTSYRKIEDRAVYLWPTSGRAREWQKWIGGRTPEPQGYAILEVSHPDPRRMAPDHEVFHNAVLVPFALRDRTDRERDYREAGEDALDAIRHFPNPVFEPQGQTLREWLRENRPLVYVSDHPSEEPEGLTADDPFRGSIDALRTMPDDLRWQVARHFAERGQPVMFYGTIPPEGVREVGTQRNEVDAEQLRDGWRQKRLDALPTKPPEGVAVHKRRRWPSTPKSKEQHAEELLGRADELGKRYDAPVSATGIEHVAPGAFQAGTDHLWGHNGERTWQGVLRFGPGIWGSIETYNEARKGEIGPLDDRELADVFVAYEVAEHEVLHAVNPLVFGEYDDDDGSRGLEEALTEELAQRHVLERLAEHGMQDVLEWVARNPEHPHRRGTYHAYRHKLRTILERAGYDVDGEDAAEVFSHMQRMKFKMTQVDRFKFLAGEVAENTGMGEEEAERWVRDTMSLPADPILRARNGGPVDDFKPVLAPERPTVPGVKGASGSVRAGDLVEVPFDVWYEHVGTKWDGGAYSTPEERTPGTPEHREAARASIWKLGDFYPAKVIQVSDTGEALIHYGGRSEEDVFTEWVEAERLRPAPALTRHGGAAREGDEVLILPHDRQTTRVRTTARVNRVEWVRGGFRNGGRLTDTDAKAILHLDNGQYLEAKDVVPAGHLADHREGVAYGDMVEGPDAGKLGPGWELIGATGAPHRGRVLGAFGSRWGKTGKLYLQVRSEQGAVRYVDADEVNRMPDPVLPERPEGGGWEFTPRQYVSQSPGVTQTNGQANAPATVYEVFSGRAPRDFEELTANGEALFIELGRAFNTWGNLAGGIRRANPGELDLMTLALFDPNKGEVVVSPGVWEEFSEGLAIIDTDAGKQAVYRSTQTLVHELLHALNPLGRESVDWNARRFIPAYEALEEALTEELAHPVAMDWLRSMGLAEVAEWAERNRADDRWARGGYLPQRQALFDMLEEAGVTDREALLDRLATLKFKTGPENRYNKLAGWLADGPSGEVHTRGEGVEYALARMTLSLSGLDDPHFSRETFEPRLYAERERTPRQQEFRRWNQWNPLLDKLTPDGANRVHGNWDGIAVTRQGDEFLVWGAGHYGMPVRTGTRAYVLEKLAGEQAPAWATGSENIADPDVIRRLVGEFEFDGVTTRVTSVKWDGEADTRQTVVLKGAFYDDDGPQQTGEFDRRYFKRADGKWTASHDSIAYWGYKSGAGIAFVQHTEREYPALGIDRVKLAAGSTRGGYVWAKQGYEFTTFRDRTFYNPATGEEVKLPPAEGAAASRRSSAWALFTSRWGDFKGDYDYDVEDDGPMAKAVTEADLRAFAHQFAGALILPDGTFDEYNDTNYYPEVVEGRGGPYFEHPREIAEWGRDKTWTEVDANGEHTMWLGKKFLMGANWDGEKRLESDTESDTDAGLPPLASLRDTDAIGPVWEVKRDEYVGGFPKFEDFGYSDFEEALNDRRGKEGDTPYGRAIEEHSRRKKEWERATEYAVNMGWITPEFATEQGMYFDGNVTVNGGYQPLPERLWHVTTARDAVLASGGLKSRVELGQIGGNGLGGGPSDTISFTDDEQVGHRIREAVQEASDVAKGIITPDDLVEQARTGEGADKPWLGDLLRYWGATDWKDGDPYPEGFQYALAEARGEHKVRYIGAIHRSVEDAKAEFGIDDVEGHGPPLIGGDGVERFVRFKVPATLEHTVEGRMNLYKNWASYRERAGGPMDPGFIGNDDQSLYHLDPDQIALLELASKPGARGFRASALGEVRTKTGDSTYVVAVDDEPILPTLSAEREDVPERFAAAPNTHDFLKVTRDAIFLNERYERPEGVLYDGTADLLLKEGRAWKAEEGRELPEEWLHLKGELGECFKNAAQAIMFSFGQNVPPGARYVEGYAYTPKGWPPIPVHHAWIVDGDGHVYELTWPIEGAEYIGVEVDESRLRRLLLARKMYGVLDNWEQGFPELKMDWSDQDRLPPLKAEQEPGDIRLSGPMEELLIAALEGNVFLHQRRYRGGAGAKVVAALRERGLVEDVTGDGGFTALAPSALGREWLRVNLGVEGDLPPLKSVRDDAGLEAVRDAPSAPAKVPVFDPPRYGRRTVPAPPRIEFDAERGPGVAVQAPVAGRVGGGESIDARKWVSEADLVDVFNGFEYGGLRVEAEQIGGGIHGFVYDRIGKEAGAFQRDIRRDGDGNVVVDHALFTMEDGYRGNGFATALNTYAFAEYRRLGVAKVEVSTEDVGGYTWAAAGFKWKRGKTAEQQRILTKAVEDGRWYAMKHGLDGYPKVPDTLLDEFTELVKAGAFESEAEMAAFGREFTWTGPSPAKGARENTVLWLGKVIMLNANWRGWREP